MYFEKTVKNTVLTIIKIKILIVCKKITPI